VRTIEKITGLILTAFVFLLSGISLSAQQIHLSLSKDTIGYNENVTLTLSGEMGNENFSAGIPQTEGAGVISTTESSSYNSSNGKIKFSKTYVLSPYKIGTFTMGPGWVQTGSRRIYSNNVKLVILAGTKEDNTKGVFLRCEPDKKKVVLGEQIKLSLKLYKRINVTSTDQNLAVDPFNGFYTYEGNPDYYPDDTIAFVNGLPYQVVTIYQRFLFPNRTGELTIPSFKYICFIKQNPFPTGDPFIDESMGIETEQDLVSAPVKIEVSDVPAKNKPENFKGDIGEYALSSSIDHGEVKANESVILNVSISGKGNVNFIQFPETKFPDGIESYPAVSSDSSEIGKSGMRGVKKFQVTLIPKKDGNYTIPEISFSYYDPDKKEYRTLTTPEFQLKVNPADPSTEISENNLPDSFQDTQSPGKMIRKISLIGLPPLLLILGLILFARNKKKKREIASQPDKNDQNELADNFIFTPKRSDIGEMINIGESMIYSGKTKAGIAQLYETLLTALCEKTELTREEASIHQIRFRLEIKHFSKEFASEILQLLTELSELRYSSQPIDPSKLVENIAKLRKLTLQLA
jgi:hypothetical protein